MADEKTLLEKNSVRGVKNAFIQEAEGRGYSGTDGINQYIEWLKNKAKDEIPDSLRDDNARLERNIRSLQIELERVYNAFETATGMTFEAWVANEATKEAANVLDASKTQGDAQN